MGSERLPGKVLMPLLDQPMLGQVIQRASRSRMLDALVVATTTDARDDAIVSVCEREGWLYYRGSEQDVLDRYYQAAKALEATVIVRITSDCPLIDASVIDYVIAAYHSVAPSVDYASNVVLRTYPRGLDVEVCSFAALERSWIEDELPERREHVTLYMRRNPERFVLHDVVNPHDYSALRLTVDTPQDFALVQQIYTYFGHNRFDWREVLAVLAQHPAWADINGDVKQKEIP
jgi:spore coat polysaccharide biosynthesis protein SpsF